MSDTRRNQPGFSSLAKRRRRSHRNRVRGDYDQRNNRGRIAEAEALADVYADYALSEEILNQVTRGEL